MCVAGGMKRQNNTEDHCGVYSPALLDNRDLLNGSWGHELTSASVKLGGETGLWDYTHTHMLHGCPCVCGIVSTVRAGVHAMLPAGRPGKAVVSPSLHQHHHPLPLM